MLFSRSGMRTRRVEVADLSLGDPARILDGRAPPHLGGATRAVVQYPPLGPADHALEQWILDQVAKARRDTAAV
jgi:hypothetical protein